MQIGCIKRTGNPKESKIQERHLFVKKMLAPTHLSERVPHDLHSTYSMVHATIFMERWLPVQKWLRGMTTQIYLTNLLQTLLCSNWFKICTSMGILATVQDMSILQDLQNCFQKLLAHRRGGGKYAYSLHQTKEYTCAKSKYSKARGTRGNVRGTPHPQVWDAPLLSIWPPQFLVLGSTKVYTVRPP